METDTWVSCKLNSEKLSALLIACYHGHLEIVKVLLNQPWLLESEEENVDQNSLDVAVSKGQVGWTWTLPLAMQFDNFVYSPLHLAAMKGDIAILQDFGGFSPPIVSEVFGNNHLLHESNRNGNTILHVAISKSHCQPLVLLACLSRRTIKGKINSGKNDSIQVNVIPFQRKSLMRLLMVAHKAMWVAVAFTATAKAYVAGTKVIMPDRLEDRWVF
ncbi:hypothetical protein KPL70_020435 [Citrus sinensis]|nr:hypothetical protein KPL70_020435 [Citrus sinensis]